MFSVEFRYLPRGNIIGSDLFASNMKEIDDTPVSKNESELNLQEEIALLRLFIDEDLDKWMKEIAQRVANLETQRTPQDENDDPEWF